MKDLSDTIVRELTLLLEEDDKAIPAMTPDLVLLESGLDSLGFAVLVTRLDDELGYDPFSLMEEAVYPRTLGEFVAIYREHAPEQ